MLGCKCAKDCIGGALCRYMCLCAYMMLRAKHTVCRFYTFVSMQAGGAGVLAEGAGGGGPPSCQGHDG